MIFQDCSTDNGAIGKIVSHLDTKITQNSENLWHNVCILVMNVLCVSSPSEQ